MVSLVAHARSFVYNSTTFIFCGSFTSFSLWIAHLPPPLPHFIFPLLISVTGAWLHWCGGSWLEGMEEQKTAVVRALASHQCGPVSNPGINTICGLSLLLVLFLAPRGFSQGSTVFPFPRKPALPNSNSIWNAWTRFNEFLRTPKCSVGKQITNSNYYNGT